MKRIINIIALFALLVTACSKEDICQAEANEGALLLNYSFLESRADDGNSDNTDSTADALMAASTLKIFKSNGDLIRQYAPATEAPSELYLIAGSYSASLSSGEDHYTTTSEEDCSYFGSCEFEIVAGKSCDIDLKATLSNTIVEVVYDETIATNFESGYITYISAQDSYTQEEAESNEIYTLSFTESGRGYFILPKGISNLSWGFSATHIDSFVGEVSTSGVIEAPKAATKYTLTLKYSPTATGSIDFNVNIDRSEEVFDDGFSFSPQPTISSDEFDISQPQNYANEEFTYDISSIEDLATINMEIYNEDGEVESTVSPLADGEVVDLSAEGITYSIKSNNSGALTLSTTLFDRYTNGGIKNIKVTAISSDDSSGEQMLQFRVAGFVHEPIVDLWANSAQIETCVALESYNEVTFSYRKAGNEEWSTTTLAPYKEGLYRAVIAPTWVESKSSGGATRYFLAAGFTAGSTFEYKYSVDGIDQEVRSITTTGAQTITDGGMESGSLSCWGQSNKDASWWASGNNGYAEKLCTQGTLGGMVGSHCAVLAGTDVTMVNLAAGNLFLGQFERPSLTTGRVSFGQGFDWKSRPQSFKLKYSASLGSVNAKYHSGAPLEKGDQDIARIFFAIVDWSGRHNVSSGTGAPTGVWNPDTTTEVTEGRIIGYAFKDITASTSGDMSELELPVYYYDKVSKPTGPITIVISCSTSAYGDYMTGSTNSKLYVDDFKFGY